MAASASCSAARLLTGSPVDSSPRCRYARRAPITIATATRTATQPKTQHAIANTRELYRPDHPFRPARATEYLCRLQNGSEAENPPSPRSGSRSRSLSERASAPHRSVGAVSGVPVLEIVWRLVAVSSIQRCVHALVTRASAASRIWSGDGSHRCRGRDLRSPGRGRSRGPRLRLGSGRDSARAFLTSQRRPTLTPRTRSCRYLASIALTMRARARKPALQQVRRAPAGGSSIHCAGPRTSLLPRR